MESGSRHLMRKVIRVGGLLGLLNAGIISAQASKAEEVRVATFMGHHSNLKVSSLPQHQSSLAGIKAKLGIQK